MSDYPIPTPEDYDRINGIDRSMCEDCGGLGQYSTGAGFVYCSCEYGQHAFSENLARKRRLARQDENIPLRYKSASFEDYDPPFVGKTNAVNGAKEFTQNRDAWLGLYGDFGTGKTHLACATLNNLLDNGIPCLYVRLADLVSEIIGSYDKNNTHTVMGKYKSIEVLLIDEIGMARISPHTNDVLEAILRFRYNEYKPTILTTNHHPAMLSEMLEERINHIISTQAKWYEMAGKNMRSAPTIIEADDD